MNLRPKAQIVKFAPLRLRKDREDGEYALLTWSSRNGYPRITVFTENKVKQETFDFNRMINAPLDYTTLNTFIGMFEKVIAGEKDKSYKIDCFNLKYVNNERTNEKYLQASITIGKNKDGVVFLAVVAEGKPKISFELNYTTFFKVYKDGEPITDRSELSCLYAAGYLRTLKKIVGSRLIEETINKNTLATTNPVAATTTQASKTNVDSNGINPDDLF